MGIVFACMTVWSFHLADTWGGLKRVLNPLGLELEVILNHHVGTGEKTKIIYKVKQCF